MYQVISVGPIVGVVIVVGCYSELDAFSGNGIHAFVLSRIAMAATGECVDVGIRRPSLGVGTSCASVS